MAPRKLATFLMLFLGLWLWDSYDTVGAQGAPNNFIIPADIPNRFPSYVRPSPSYVDAIVLVANTPQVWTAPANTRFVIFSSTCNFYAFPNGAAAVPGANVTNGTASELNPAAWYFSPTVTTIGLSAPTACVVTLAAYLGRAS